MSIMICSRTSAFSRYIMKPMCLQNVQPLLEPKRQELLKNTNINFKNIQNIQNMQNMQKRKMSSFTPREPNKGPPAWLLVLLGTYIIFNAPSRR